MIVIKSEYVMRARRIHLVRDEEGVDASTFMLDHSREVRVDGRRAIVGHEEDVPCKLELSLDTLNRSHPDVSWQNQVQVAGLFVEFGAHSEAEITTV